MHSCRRLARTRQTRCQRTRTLIAPRCTSNSMNCGGSLITAPTLTGTNDAAVLGSLSNSRLHLCTRLALIPWAIATVATEAPGVAHSQRLVMPPARTPLSFFLGVHLASLVDTILVVAAIELKTGLPDAYAPRA